MAYTSTRHLRLASSSNARLQSREIWVYPGFPTPFCGLSGFFVGDLIGKALWELVENAQRFPRHGGRVLCVHGAVSFHRARPCATRWLPGRGPCVMSNWTVASSDCSRPANNYVRVNTVDLYTPNARFTPERLGYQVLTLFGKLGYSQKYDRRRTRTPAQHGGPSARGPVRGGSQVAVGIAAENTGAQDRDQGRAGGLRSQAFASAARGEGR